MIIGDRSLPLQGRRMMTSPSWLRWALTTCIVFMAIESLVLILKARLELDKPLLAATRDREQIREQPRPSVLESTSNIDLTNLIVENKKLVKKMDEIMGHLNAMNISGEIGNASVKCGPLSNVLNVSTDAINPFYRLEMEQFNFCIDNCNMMGIGSNLVRKAMLHNMSQIMGFKLWFQDEFVDFVREEIHGDFLRPVIPGANFFPPKCDFLWGGHDSHKFGCFRERLMFQNAFDIYHVQMYLLLAETYSLRLRSLATEAFAKLVKKFERFSPVQFVGVHVRHEFQYEGMKSDRRKDRDITIENYYEVMRDFEAKHVPEDSVTVYLAMGDSALSEFKPVNYVLVEPWLEEEYPKLSRLQIMTVAIDILSHCRLRIISKFGNNIYIHLGFHRLNNNIFDVIIGDVFVMRKYDYFGKELEVVGEGFDIKGYFKTDKYNPYLMEPSAWSHNYAVDCFRENLYTARAVPQKFGTNKDCLKRFKESEVGRKRQNVPKTYPAKDLKTRTDFF